MLLSSLLPRLCLFIKKKITEQIKAVTENSEMRRYNCSIYILMCGEHLKNKLSTEG
jgi:hypothetical protein